MWGNLSGVISALLILAFLGIFWWAWSGSQRRRFDEAAQLALDPEDRDIPLEQMEHRS